MRRFAASLTVGWTLLLGCAPNPVSDGSPSPPAESAPIGARFNPAFCGRVQGRVLWHGAQPRVPDYLAPLSPRAESGFPLGRHRFPNPRAPRICQHQYLANVVVLLRGIDPARSRPWDKPPVRVELKDQRLFITQGDVVSPYGFVQRGQAIELVSHDAEFHSIQARGAAFFTIPFADREVVRQRTLRPAGRCRAGQCLGLFLDGGPSLR